MSFDEAVDVVGKVVDGAGVAVIVAGAVLASARCLVQWRRSGQFAGVYRQYRQDLGRAVLLGLELLVAGDIIRTVAVAPTFRGLGTVGLLVLIRTFLSVALIVELEGRWPWQQRSPPIGSTHEPQSRLAGQPTTEQKRREKGTHDEARSTR